jgi:hypothetical protein
LQLGKQRGPPYSIVMQALLMGRSDGVALDANNSPECFAKHNR